MWSSHKPQGSMVQTHKHLLAQKLPTQLLLAPKQSVGVGGVGKGPPHWS